MQRVLLFFMLLSCKTSDSVACIFCLFRFSFVFRGILQMFVDILFCIKLQEMFFIIIIIIIIIICLTLILLFRLDFHKL